MLGRSKSGICGKKQIKPSKRERKRDPKVVSFRKWFLGSYHNFISSKIKHTQINKTRKNYLQNLNKSINTKQEIISKI